VSCPPAAPDLPSEIPDVPVPLPITGELDLHTFRPADLGVLVPAYLDECAARSMREVRIIHGKGTGTLRTTVHALLRRLPIVASFRTGDETSGSWGATIVTLRK
jgi:dsDNA-specific endonuclease/ATPase MutS2